VVTSGTNEQGFCWNFVVSATDATSAGAVSHEGKMLFKINGQLMTFDEARPLTKGDTLENVLEHLCDKTQPRRFGPHIAT